MTFSTLSKSTAPSFLNIFKDGKSIAISELFNYKRANVVFLDGTILENIKKTAFQDISWTLPSKNSVSFSDLAKNSASFAIFLKHGKMPTLAEIANLTFPSVLFPDGKLVQDITFAQLADIAWSNLSKS